MRGKKNGNWHVRCLAGLRSLAITLAKYLESEYFFPHMKFDNKHFSMIVQCHSLCRYAFKASIRRPQCSKAGSLVFDSRPQILGGISSTSCHRPRISYKMSSSNANSSPDYTSWSKTDLITRVTALEAQLRAQTAAYHNSDSQPMPLLPSSQNPTLRRRRSLSPSRRASPFDPSKYSTRHIALKFAYLGGRYNGYEHANGHRTPLPTVEEVLWKALRKARLISPPTTGADESMEVVWNPAQRMKMEPLEISWAGCEYSKCGRTDRGVSAFGQVIGIRVRSNRPRVAQKTDADDGARDEIHESNTVIDGANGILDLPDLDADDIMSSSYEPTFHPINDELPYMTILNSILPSDIRILAWCPDPPPSFDARFSCKERRYKYFFTNPAFLPTPGPLGLQAVAGKESTTREGWLNIEAMRKAAKKLEGLHDFRNFCKIDPSKQMLSCERRIIHASIEEVKQQGGPVSLDEEPALSGEEDGKVALGNGATPQSCGPQVYSFNVNGSAFLWHQVRHMAAILFLVGQGLETPAVVDDLLDIEANPGRPMYEMASDSPLVLWDCIFANQNSTGDEDVLDWVYVGDARSIPALTIKSDGKFGLGGVVDEVWTQWRKNKMNEILSSSLLDLVIGQGDGSALKRGGFRDMEAVKTRSQKIFDGRETPRMAGRYVPVLQKPRLDGVEAQNAKYRAGKGSRRELRQNAVQEVALGD
jgi:tRNA pseudouridine38/39 synthase